MKKEERKITIELLEVERMNTYKILAEFFTRKFNERRFDKEEEKWFNKRAAKNSGNCMYKSYIVKKSTSYTWCPKFLFA